MCEGELHFHWLVNCTSLLLFVYFYPRYIFVLFVPFLQVAPVLFIVSYHSVVLLYSVCSFIRPNFIHLPNVLFFLSSFIFLSFPVTPTSLFFYSPPTKLQQGNVFRHVCLSVYRGRPPCDHYLDLFKLVYLGIPPPTSAQSPPLVPDQYPHPPPPPTPLNIQGPPWETDGWPSIERPHFNFFYSLFLSFYLYSFLHIFPISSIFLFSNFTSLTLIFLFSVLYLKV